MVINDGLENIDIVILAGGLGTRIQKILSNTPKVLAPINGTPFLEYLLCWLETFRARRVVLCLGYLAEKVEEYLDNHKVSKIKVDTVIEDKPLGTAGALRLALPLLNSKHIMVMNGDSWLDTNLVSFVQSHLDSNARLSMLCVKVDDCHRYGRVDIDDDGVFNKFVEKDKNFNGSGLINAGIYLFEKNVINNLSMVAGSSLECDIIANEPKGSINAFIVKHDTFIDIGTPDSLLAANEIL